VVTTSPALPCVITRQSISRTSASAVDAAGGAGGATGCACGEKKERDVPKAHDHGLPNDQFREQGVSLLDDVAARDWTR
jgi:hypothetical protein